MSEVSQAPRVVVLAGINGAGKTTASIRLLRDAYRIPIFVNADAIARGLNALNPEGEAARAGRIMLAELRQRVADRQEFAFETTLAGRAYAATLADMRAAGYQTHLHYYWLESAEFAIARVATRVRSGGHFVPDDTIRQRYGRSVKNFLTLYRPHCDLWTVYDNTYGTRRVLAEGVLLSEVVLDPAGWAAFQGSAAHD